MKKEKIRKEHDKCKDLLNKTFILEGKMKLYIAAQESKTSLILIDIFELCVNHEYVQHEVSIADRETS